MKYVFFTLAAVLAFASQSVAAVKYWDVNGATAGSGVVAASTTNWGTNNWSTDSTGSIATGGFTSGTDTAVFAAGTDGSVAYTVNLSSALTSAAVTIEEGTVTKTGAALSVQNITINNGAALFTNASGALTVAAGGSLTLNGPNATIGNSNTSTGGSFLGNGTANTNMPITLNGGGHVSANGGAGIITIETGLIQGTGPLSIDGSGVFRLTTVPATYTGATIINGTLQISTTANVLPNATALTINSGGKFDIQAVQTVASLDGAGNLAGNSSGFLTIAGTASTVFDGVWSGGSRLIVNKSGGTGTLTLNGVNTATGQFTLTAGTVTVNAGKALCGPVCDVFVNGGTLNLNNTSQTIENLSGTGGEIKLTSGLSLTSDPIASTAYSGVISGAGGLTRLNANATTRTLTLSGANTYDGNTIITNGVISVQNNTALGSTVGYTEVNQSSGTIAAELLFTTAAGTVTTSEPLRITGAGTSGDGGAIAVTAGATPTISGPVTLIGDSTVAVSGSSSVLYNNANSFTSLANQNLTLQGGSGTSPLGIGTISGAISLGTGSLTKQQGGTWVLSGSNTYSGVTNINAGTLSVSNIANNLGQNSTVNIGSTTTGGNLTYTGTGETTSKVINLAGTTGAAFLVQSGAGNLKFTSDLTATGAGAKTLTLQGSTAGTGEIAGAIVDNSATNTTAVAKSGSGKWVLSSASTYTGGTTVSNGTLLANNTTGSATGTGAITVNGGIFGGTGAVSGAVTVNTGGTLSPGASVAAFAAGGLTFNTGSTLYYEVDTTSPVNLASAADLLNANGNLSIASGALLSLNDVSPTPTTVATGSKLTMISYSGTWDGGTFNGAADDSVVTLGGDAYVINYNDTTPGSNFGGGSFSNYVTLTAVPEANAALLGCLVTIVLGLTVGGRKLFGKSTTV